MLKPVPKAVQAMLFSAYAAWSHTGMSWGYMRIMEKKMETTIAYWGYMGIMEKKMETNKSFSSHAKLLGRPESVCKQTDHPGKLQKKRA